MPQSHDRTGNEHKDQIDHLFKVLANERRRRVLSYLDGKDGDVATVAELVDYVMVHEAESANDLADDEVALALYHTHLPKMENANLIKYDERSRTVRYREDPRVKSYLRRTAQRE